MARRRSRKEAARLLEGNDVANQQALTPDDPEVAKEEQRAEQLAKLRDAAFFRE